jgi:hypothetical protein
MQGVETRKLRQDELVTKFTLPEADLGVVYILVDGVPRLVGAF